MTRRRGRRAGPPAVLLAAGVLLGPASAGAFTLSGARWPGAATRFEVGIRSPDGAQVSPSGVAWDAAFAEAAAAWGTEGFAFELLPRPADPCEPFPGRNGTTFRLIACSREFGAGTLAVTLSFFDGPLLQETDIVFNGWLDWDVYAGRWRSGRPEFRRVALHELGHALGLDHEEQAPAIMRPTAGAIETLQADDRAAVAALYGGCDRSDPLAPGAEVTGRLELTDCLLVEQLADGDRTFFDGFSLVLSGGGWLEATLASTEFDAWLGIARADRLASSADLLASDDDSGGGPLGTDAKLSVLLAPGEYLLLANSLDEGATGSYRLATKLVPEPGALPAGGAALAALAALRRQRRRRGPRRAPTAAQVETP